MDKRLVKTADNRYKILADQIVWNFTKDGLVSKISALQQELLDYQKMLLDINEDKVSLEAIQETK